MTSQHKTFLAIGECMIEMAQDHSGLWRMGVAGDTLNTAWYARHCLPAEWNVTYFTRVGTDRYSDYLTTFMESNRIDTSLITRDPVRQLGLYLINLDKGERSFSYWRNDSAARWLAEDEVLLGNAIAQADIIYFSGITLAILSPSLRSVLIRNMHKARTAGKTTVFDPNIRLQLWEDEQTLRALIMEAAASATITLPSFEDEKTFFGDSSPEACAQRYRNVGSDEVVVKNGGGPIYVSDTSGITIIDNLECINPIDTTGAGDSFNGGYLATRNLGASPEAAVRAGHALAMKVICHHGALMQI